jgi:fatty-acyl-CoA synthase
MAAIATDRTFDITGLYRYLFDLLPAYAVPVFVRLVAEIEATDTFKPKKQQLMSEGFDPAAVADPLHVADPSAQAYVPLTAERHARLTAAGAAA